MDHPMGDPLFTGAFPKNLFLRFWVIQMIHFRYMVVFTCKSLEKPPYIPVRLDHPMDHPGSPLGDPKRVFCDFRKNLTLVKFAWITHSGDIYKSSTAIFTIYLFFANRTTIYGGKSAKNKQLTTI